MIRLPTGSSPGKNSLAKLSVTIATRGALRSSCALKSRPRKSGTRTVLKKSAVTTLTCAIGCCDFGNGRSSMLKVKTISLPLSGIHHAPAAELIPGDADTFASSFLKNSPACSGLLYLESGNATRTVTTLVGSKPGCTFCRRRKLWTSRLALASNTNARTISTTTSRARVRPLCKPSVDPRTFSLSDPVMFGCDARHAGKSPANNAAPRLTSAVNAITRRSGDTSAIRGMFAGKNAFNESSAQIAIINPITPPPALRSTLSESSCLTMCQRLAPSAVRMLISF